MILPYCAVRTVLVIFPMVLALAVGTLLVLFVTIVQLVSMGPSVRCVVRERLTGRVVATPVERALGV